MSPDTPQAILLTSPGEGGIGIIALRGPGAMRVLGRVFGGTRRAAAELEPGMMAHGTIRRDGRVLDEVILARVEPDAPAPPGPWYEVNCHGGVMAVRAVLDRLIEAGARRADLAPPAGPPLSREGIRRRALAALPHAPTRLTVLMLLHQARGALADEAERIAGLLEHDQAAEAVRRLDALLETAPLGRALLEAPRVALIGPPNAGKSTLFNALFEQERVIVHEEPGTTRDIVSEVVSVRGVPFRIMDAAGIGETADEVERLAVERARALARQCEVALAVFDVRRGADAGLIPPMRPEARLITVLNKTDLLEGPPPDSPAAGGPVVRISARERTNLADLEDALLAPYAALLPRCREGGPIVFSGEIEDALRRLRPAP